VIGLPRTVRRRQAPRADAGRSVAESLPLPRSAARPVLALGGHLQVTVTLGIGGRALRSERVGDLEHLAARERLADAAASLERRAHVEAEVIAVDLHPDYPSAWFGEELAQRRGARLLRVQHHLAHAAAVLGEHGALPQGNGRAAAIVLDGTGYGTDGTPWGAEWIALDGDLGWRRCASSEPLPLVGGERAVREPWRVAAGALARCGLAELLPRLPLARDVDARRLEQVAALATSAYTAEAHGAGRLFEAAGALLGLATRNAYEGQAAIALEALAAGAPNGAEPWPEVALGAGAPRLPGPELLAALARRILDGEAPEIAAAGLHETFAALAVELARRTLPPGPIALGGGCLANQRLATALNRGLGAAGFEVLLAVRLPPGDGGLSYGQAVLAAAALAQNLEPRERATTGG